MMLGPVMTELKRKLNYPREFYFSECTIQNGYVPYGYGDPLLNATDVVESLQALDVIEGGPVRKMSSSRKNRPTGQPSVGEHAPLSMSSSAVGMSMEMQTIKAPMDGEGVYIKFFKQVGDTVDKEDIICEVESDKATIEVEAPCKGVIKEIFVEEGVELDVTPDTEFCTLQPSEPSISKSTDDVVPSSSTSNTSSASISSLSDDVREVPLTQFQRGMVKNMILDPATDTHCFQQFETINMKKVIKAAKSNSVTPPTVLIKQMADVVASVGMNKKLSKDRKSMQFYDEKVNIGVAVDVDGNLRTCVVRDAGNKSLDEIRKDILRFVSAGKNLKPEDTDLTDVCWTLTSIGKNATEFAVPVLPKGTTGIMSVGRMSDETGKSILGLQMCHATLTGVEGATTLRAIAEKFK